jgi:hypothetical protein
MTGKSLPPFTGGLTCCPKCGHAKVSAVWHLTGLKEAFPCDHDAGIDEHMCRKCELCGYAWVEATLDARP